MVLILRKGDSTSAAIKTSETEQSSENTLSPADEAELSVSDDYTYEIDARMLNEDMEAYLEALDILTEEEKDILIKEQTRLNELEAEIAKYYDRAADETKDLEAELEQNRNILQSIMAENQHIWDKIYGVGQPH